MPLLKPGEYQLRFHHHQTALMFSKARKVVLWFSVLDMGQDFEKRLARFYNVTRLIGQPAKHGRFKVAPNSVFVREYTRLFCSTHRLDRMPMSRFEQHIIVGKVRTVRSTGNQATLETPLQYSVIDQLLRIEQ